jgi:prolyl-tRNA synthetase
MAEATAADGQMKDLKISEVKKSKKDGAPQKAAKKPQQPKKKVRQLAQSNVSKRARD